MRSGAGQRGAHSAVQSGDGEQGDRESGAGECDASVAWILGVRKLTRFIFFE